MKQAKVLTKQELKRVLALCNTMRNGQRNRLALLLSHYAGLRVGEIASLYWNDVIDQSGKIKTDFYLKPENTKANEARQVHLNMLLQKELQIFWQADASKLGLNQPIIASQKRGQFSANSLCQLFGRIYATAGIDDASSHSGRRWFITKLAHSGVSPKVIMELAGHKQLTTTQRYIQVNDQMKRNAVDLL